MMTYDIGNGCKVDRDKAVLVLDTPGAGCYGFFRAPQIDGNGEQVYIETNGNPILLPHHLDADCDTIMTDLCRDAGVSLEQIETALGCTWQEWCT
jgi:hypothetical protein